MATRKRTTKRTTKSKTRRRSSKKQTPWIDELFATLSRPEVVGLALVIVSAFTLLSLITPSRGQVMGPWVDGLTWLVGIGVWGLPVVTAMIGLWIVVLNVERTPDIAWQRPLGLLLLLLAWLLGASLALTPAARVLALGTTSGGGALGNEMALALEQTVGDVAAWLFVLALAVGGLVLLTDRLLVDGLAALWQEFDAWRHAAQTQRMDPSLRPDVPVPDGVLPWHKQLGERLRGWWAGRQARGAGYRREVYTQPGLGYDDFANPPGNLVAPEPPPYEASPRKGRGQHDALRETQALYDATGGSGDHSGAAAKNVSPSGSVAQSVNERMGNALTESLGGGEMLTPRIVGSQEWTLPRLGNMLEDWDRRVDSDSRIREQGRLIQDTLENFGIPSSFEGAYKGPAVTQYLIKPGYTERVVRGETRRTKVKVAKIAGLANDLALALAATNVRIEAPIPGHELRRRRGAQSGGQHRRPERADGEREVPGARQRAAADCAGRGRQGTVHRFRPDQDAAPADCGRNRRRQVGGHQLDVELPAAHAHAGFAAAADGRPQDGGAERLQRHSAPVGAGGHRSRQGGGRALLGRQGDGAALHDF